MLACEDVGKADVPGELLPEVTQQLVSLQTEVEFLRAHRVVLEREAKLLLEENVQVTQQLSQLRNEVESRRETRESDPQSAHQIAELRAQVTLLRRGKAELEEAHAALEAEHGRLVMGARIQSERALGASDGLQAENERLREELRMARVQVEEMQRLCEQHACERGALEAEASRLRAENSVMADEARDLLAKLEEAESRHVNLAEGDSSFDFNAPASPLYPAEQWVLYHAAQPADQRALTYPGGVHVDFVALAPEPAAAAFVAANYGQLVRVLEGGEAARGSLQAFRVHDTDGRGFLEWAGGKVQEFVEAVLLQYGVPAAKEAQVYEAFRLFGGEAGGGQLDARGCLCLVDTLLRAAACAAAAMRSGGGGSPLSRAPVQAVGAAPVPSLRAAQVEGRRAQAVPVHCVATPPPQPAPQRSQPQASASVPIRPSALPSLPKSVQLGDEFVVPADFEEKIEKRLAALEKAADETLMRIAARRTQTGRAS